MFSCFCLLSIACFVFVRCPLHLLFFFLLWQEGTDLFHSYITRERRSYAEVLCEFDSVSVPLGVSTFVLPMFFFLFFIYFSVCIMAAVACTTLRMGVHSTKMLLLVVLKGHFIALVPRLKPRYFSIASAAAGRPGTFELSVAVVAYKTPWRRQRHGVCSNWLAHAAAGEGGGGESPLTIPVWFKKGSLRLPPDVARDDVLLVGECCAVLCCACTCWHVRSFCPFRSCGWCRWLEVPLPTSSVLRLNFAWRCRSYVHGRHSRTWDWGGSNASADPTACMVTEPPTALRTTDFSLCECRGNAATRRRRLHGAAKARARTMLSLLRMPSQ